jgi:hypothetical protein
MTASQPLFCLNVNQPLTTGAGSIHDVVGSYFFYIFSYVFIQSETILTVSLFTSII